MVTYLSCWTFAGPSSRSVVWRRGMMQAGGRRLTQAAWGSVRTPGQDCGSISQSPGMRRIVATVATFPSLSFPFLLAWRRRLGLLRGLADPVPWWPQSSAWGVIGTTVSGAADWWTDLRSLGPHLRGGAVVCAEVASSATVATGINDGRWLGRAGQ
jgi:hypothetical protein